MESYIQKYKKLLLNSLKSKPPLASLFLLLPIPLLHPLSSLPPPYPLGRMVSRGEWIEY